LELCISFPRLSLNPSVGAGLLRATVLGMLYVCSRKLTFLLLFVIGYSKVINTFNQTPLNQFNQKAKKLLL